MNKIKFSGEYRKLHGQTEATLLFVREIRIDSLTPKVFLDYDTTRTDGSTYELKDGQYILLVFLGNLGIPFTTVRSLWGKYGNKLKYYKALIGQEFAVEVSG